MRRIRSVGLVCAGPISRGTVAKLPGITEHIGWVKAPSFRLASRAVNALRAGEPIHAYEGLAQSALILVSVPRSAQDHTISELASAALDWRTKPIVVIDTVSDSDGLKPLTNRGAAVATLQLVNVGDVRTLVIEGHQEAIRRMQMVIAPAARRTMQTIRTGGKSRLLAGLHEATQGFLPVIMSVTDHFRAAGLSKQQSETLAQALVTGSMRSYFRAGRRVLTEREE